MEISRILILLVAMSGLGVFPAPASADDKPAAGIDKTDGKTGWLLRAMEAVYRAEFNSAEDVEALLYWLPRERYRYGQMVLVDCLNRCDVDLCYLLAADVHIEWLIPRLDDPNRYVREGAFVLLKIITLQDHGTTAKGWQRWWDKAGAREQFHKAREQRRRAMLKTGKYAMPDPVSSANGAADGEREFRSVVPEPLRDHILALQKGVDAVFCMDDTGSMTGWTSTVADAAFVMFAVLDTVCEKTRGGVVTYKDDVNLVLQFTEQREPMRKFLGGIEPCGGGDGREDIQGAVKYAAEKFEWRKDTVNSIIVMGDSLAKGTSRWVKACGDVHKTTAIRIHTVTVKNDPPDGWAEAALAGGGTSYCMNQGMSMVECVVCAASGGNRFDRLRDLVRFLIPRVLEDERDARGN